MKKKIKKLFINGCNISHGGPLTILKEAIISANLYLKKNWEINLIIFDKRIFSKKEIIFLKKNKIKIYQFPRIKNSWVQRILHELFFFRKKFKNVKIDLWLSIQDVTTLIKAKKKYVYCHNPIPFYRMSFKDIYFEPISFIRGLLFKAIYKINILSNDGIIVQQSWLRELFSEWTNHKNIIVSQPNFEKKNKNITYKKKLRKKIFIYPSVPRFQKNFEVVCKAAEILIKKGIKCFQIKLTFKANENRYSKFLYKNYSKYNQIKFIGYQNKKNMDRLYKLSDSLIFSSKLETWGLPISEAAENGLQLFIAKKNYAYETVGSYKKVNFFNESDPIHLSKLMNDYIRGELRNSKLKKIKIKKPYTKNWKEFWKLIK